jgi:hypothetical protein
VESQEAGTQGRADGGRGLLLLTGETEGWGIGLWINPQLSQGLGEPAGGEHSGRRGGITCQEAGDDRLEPADDVGAAGHGEGGVDAKGLGECRRRRLSGQEGRDGGSVQIGETVSFAGTDKGPSAGGGGQEAHGVAPAP